MQRMNQRSERLRSINSMKGLTLIFVVGLQHCINGSTLSSSEKFISVVGQLENLERSISRIKRASADWDKEKIRFNFEERVAILEMHNKYRSGIHALDMNALTWDTDLEDVAQSYAEECMFEHSYIEDVGEFNYVGENLYASAGMFDTKAVERWYDSEYLFFDYDSNTCAEGEQCGHYTQVVWASTTKTGCGIRFCNTLGVVNSTNLWYVVCNYGIAGNFRGMLPYQYIDGVTCLLCDADFPDCTDSGLCYQADCGGKTCSNGGVLLPIICECNCSATDYTGTLCDPVITTPANVKDTTTTIKGETTTDGVGSAGTTTAVADTTRGDGSEHVQHSTLCILLPLISVKMWLIQK